MLLLGATASPAWAQAPNPPPITMPQLLEPLAPEYPATGTRDARVVLRVTLNKEGAVTRVEVVEGEEPYASAAILAAENGKFSPALRGDQPVAAVITVAVDFAFSAAESEPAPLPPEPVPTRSQPSPTKTPAGPGAPPVVEPPPEPMDIVVTARRVDDSERPIHKAEARLTAGTFGDPLRAVELLPGILPVISGVPYYFVRGAPPGSVNFYIDDARVPTLYHVGPGSSVLHPQLVEGVALRSGPYRARYGDASSGVVTTQLINQVPAFGSELEAKVFESAGYVGAPILDDRGTIALAGKVSHLGPVLELTNPELRLNYWDYQALGSYQASPRDQFTLLALGAGDFVGEVEQEDVDINIDSVFHRLKVGYGRNLESGTDLGSYVILGRDGSRFDQDGEEFSSNSISGGLVLSQVIDAVWDWAVGISAEATDYDASEAWSFPDEGSNVAVSRTDRQGAAWAEVRVAASPRVTLDAGLRGAVYDSLDRVELSLEPRLSSTMQLSERWKAILAVGYSTQAPTFAIPSPAVRPAGLRGGLQRALQRAATLRYGEPGVLTAESTLFYNDYRDLSDPLSLSTVPDPLEVGDAQEGGEPPREDMAFDERPNGRSFGMELIVRRPFTNELSGTLAYTLSRSTRRLGGTDVPSSFDRTHMLNVTLGYDFGHGYRAGTRFMAYSGLPVRELGVPLGRTGDRSDPFLRWDVRFSKEWKLSWSHLMLIVEVLNATFQEEVLGVACSPAGCETATFGPVTVPSIGLRGTFGGAIENDAR